MIFSNLPLQTKFSVATLRFLLHKRETHKLCCTAIPIQGPAVYNKSQSIMTEVNQTSDTTERCYHCTILKALAID